MYFSKKQRFGDENTKLRNIQTKQGTEAGEGWLWQTKESKWLLETLPGGSSQENGEYWEREQVSDNKTADERGWSGWLCCLQQTSGESLQITSEKIWSDVG